MKRTVFCFLFSIFYVYCFSQVTKEVLITTPEIDIFTIYDDYVYVGGDNKILKYDLNDLDAAPEELYQGGDTRLEGLTPLGDYLYFGRYSHEWLYRVPHSTSLGTAVDSFSLSQPNVVAIRPLRMHRYEDYIYILEQHTTGGPEYFHYNSPVSRIDMSASTFSKENLVSFFDNHSDLIVDNDTIYTTGPYRSIYAIHDINSDPQAEHLNISVENNTINYSLAKIGNDLFTINKDLDSMNFLTYKTNIYSSPVTHEVYADFGANSIFAYEGKLYGADNNTIFLYSSPLTNSQPEVPQEGNIFPNPTSDLINFEVTPDMVTVYDILGKQVDVQLQGNMVDLSHLPSGAYLVVYTIKDKPMVTEIVYKS